MKKIAVVSLLIMSLAAMAFITPTSKVELTNSPRLTMPCLIYTTNPAHSGWQMTINSSVYPVKYWSGSGFPPTCGASGWVTLNLEQNNTYSVYVQPAPGNFSGAYSTSIKTPVSYTSCTVFDVH